MTTGTTIVGITYKDGVVLGCDTRITLGNIVWEKIGEKIYRIQENIFCAGCGSAADMDAMVLLMRANTDFHRLNTNRKFIPVVSVVTPFKRLFFDYKGAFGCHFIFGGVDNYGPHIYILYSQGSVTRLPYATSGSGGYASMSIIETRWKPDMSEIEAKELVADAVTAGVLNDLGSGSNVDLCVVRKGKSEKIFGYRTIGFCGERIYDYKVKRGTTAILSQTIKNIEIDVIEEKIEKMLIE